MIYDIVQTKNGLDMEWIALGDDILAEIAAPCVQGEYDVFIEGKDISRNCGSPLMICRWELV